MALRRSRRNRRLMGTVVTALLLAVVGWGAIALLQGGSALLDGRNATQRAQAALAEADVVAAEAAFREAHDAFADGEARLAALPLDVSRWLPVAGPNVDAARRLAEGGALVTDAGATVAGALAGLDGGLEAFAPRDGRIPLATIEAVAGPLADAAEKVTAAEETVADAPNRGLVGPLAVTRDDFAGRLGETGDALRAGAALARELPAFLGAEGPRHYFLGAQNPAELRGTGGLIGAYTVVTAHDGRLDIGDFRTIGTLTRGAPEDLPPPTEEYAARYARYSAGVHGSNVNMTPDVPTAAAAIERLHEAVTGQSLDGTILADPYFLEALLDVVGPTDVPAVGRVEADSVVEFVTRDQYAELADHGAERKEVLGEVAKAVIERFLAGEGNPRAAIGALGAAADGRLWLHAADESVQGAFVEAGLDGGLAEPDGDYLAVVGNNAGANKLDTFLSQEIAYDVRLRPDGSAHGTLTVELENTAPTDGYHQTVLGPSSNADFLMAGQSRTIWSVYCAPDCLLEEFRRNGEPEGVTSELERDRPVYSTTVTLASGESQTLEFEWVAVDVWDPAEGETGYRLALDGQPTLAEGTTSVRVQALDGVGDVVADPPMRVRDGVATWEGALSDRLVLEAGADTGERSLASVAREALNRPLFVLGGR